MKNEDIIRRLKLAISSVIIKDNWLLINNLSEQSISHKLAEYLQYLFVYYDIDCEYNGNIEVEKGRKRIIALKRELRKAKIELSKTEKKDRENELINRAVFPDIIIHQRGTNERNLCVIEVKKSTSNRIACAYDEIKLQSYTTDYYGNGLRYQLGAYIEFEVNQENPKYNIKYFKGGKQYNL